MYVMIKCRLMQDISEVIYCYNVKHYIHCVAEI